MLTTAIRERFSYRKSIWPKRLLGIFKASTACSSLSLETFTFLTHSFQNLKFTICPLNSQNPLVSKDIQELDKSFGPGLCSLEKTIFKYTLCSCTMLAIRDHNKRNERHGLKSPNRRGGMGGGKGR